METKAHEIVRKIIADLTNRRGLRQEFDMIDEETQNEILQTWQKIVEECLDD